VSGWSVLYTLIICYLLLTLYLNFRFIDFIEEGVARRTELELKAYLSEVCYIMKTKPEKNFPKE